MKQEKFTVLSLGGSLIVPDGINEDFLYQFKKFILKWAKKGKRFFIVTGGGKTVRSYQRAARELGVKDKASLDQLGIDITYVNARLVKSLFGKAAYPEVVKDYAKNIKTNAKIIVASGWKPGCSTDFDAVYAAWKYKASRIVNLSNIEWLYDKDPRAYSDAEPIETISFSKLLKITGKVWIPGANMPFDPKASQMARKHNMEVIIANGKDFDNLDNLFKDEPFRGTVVSNDF
ncbi:MAG: UMP kinase [Candidatus Paceibacterota bacterium]|jgi:uridylate kinase|nr:UMP kinase [Candidatus Paceibacterota bacterium]MDD4830649.1 UMP kinase [Candidatus Paceibacterota bacterium]MDD4875162.1 UMP kinase [Candidatus Paceibacterota bacterium]